MAKSIDEVIAARGLTETQTITLLLEFCEERKIIREARAHLAAGEVTTRYGRLIPAVDL